jgi:hypothetical protein
MKSIRAFLALNSLFFVCLQPQIATATTLYNGSGRPEAQGWLIPGGIKSSGIPLVNITPYQTIESNGITIRTNNIEPTVSPSAGYLGYSNHTANFRNLSELQLVNSGFPTLDINIGYSIFFDAAVNPVIDNDDNRAAFSLIVISSDLTKGIELDFDVNRIFAQSDTVSAGSFSEFIRAETSDNFNTNNSNSYELRIKNLTYQLFANNNPIALLTGNLKDYEFDINTTDPNLPFNPYETANFLFFGNLTDKASGEFTLGSVRVEAADATTTPEFTPILSLALVGISFTTSRVLAK